jgi:hypothetical protein
MCWAGIAAGAAGCSHHTPTGGAAATASALATSPQVRAAEAKLKTCISKCLFHNLIRGGRAGGS